MDDYMKMNIVVASDENYAPHLETLLVSIAENNKWAETISVLVLDGGISSESMNSLKETAHRYSYLKIDSCQMDDKTISNWLGENISKDRSLSTYARVFIPELLKEDRALYLDVDAIVLGSLEGLYNLDMEGYAIAGVRDTNPISRHRNVGLSDSDIYINAGMILWNLKKCREIDSVQQCVNFVKNRNGNVDAMDQGTINGVFGKQGLIKLVHPRYNAFTSLFQLDNHEICSMYSLPEYYSDAEIMQAKQTPVFIHFTPNMTTRPWVEHCKHPLRDEYWRFRKMTHYQEYILQPDQRNIKLKILSWGFYHLPFQIWNWMVKMR